MVHELFRWTHEAKQPRRRSPFERRESGRQSPSDNPQNPEEQEQPRGQGREVDRKDVDNSGWAVSTLAAALWAFNTSATFEEGLIAAVNLGGDADSIGAVYGQLAGAYYGFNAIPERWVKSVKDWAKVDALIGSFLSIL